MIMQSETIVLNVTFVAVVTSKVRSQSCFSFVFVVVGVHPMIKSNCHYHCFHFKQEMKNLVQPLQCDFNPKLARAILLRRATVWHDRVEVQPRQDRHVGLAGRSQVVDQRLRQLKLLDGQTFSSFRSLKTNRNKLF